MNGNLVREEVGDETTNKIINNEFDVLNRLIKTLIQEQEYKLIEDGRHAGSEEWVDIYVSETKNTYNGDGQRIKKDISISDEFSNNTNSCTNYFYQNGIVSSTTDSSGKMTSRNMVDLDGNVFATKRYETNSESDYYFYNHDIQGSAMTILNNEGDFLTGYKYTDFGETKKYGDTNFYNEIGYTGGVFDESSELLYLNSRFYNPNKGRFLNMDTYRGEQEQPDTLNLYAYCSNNPINYNDPTGHWKGRFHRLITNKAYNRFTTKTKPSWLTKARLEKIIKYNIATDSTKSVMPFAKWGKKYPRELEWLKQFNSYYIYKRLKHRSYHGHRFSVKRQESLIEQAQGAYSNNKNTAFTYLGRAIHTSQDIYAHRRNPANGLKQPIKDAKNLNWHHYFDIDDFTPGKYDGVGKASNLPKKFHSTYMDDWQYADTKTKRLAITKTYELLKKVSF